MKHTTIIAGALLALSAPATAQAFSDNFDTYANGTVLNGVGGWKGWDNNVAVAGVVTNARRISLPNSMVCDGPTNTDAIHPVTGATSGKWLLSVKQRIQLGDLGAGNVFVIGNNQYNDGGPYIWAIQCSASNTTTTVTDDLRGGSLPLVYNRWVEYCFEIDLDNNTMDTYYDGQLLSSGAYALGATDPVEFANLDLYSNGGTCNFDDVNFRPCGTFTNYGMATAGSGAIVPTITGGRCPNATKPFTVDIASALGGAQGVLLFGTTPLNDFPFFGGFLQVLPDIAVSYTLAGSGNGNGTKTFTFGVPGTVAMGSNFYFQSLHIDAGAVQGISFTDGLQVTTGS